MAEKLNTYQIPNEGKVIDVDYAIYGGSEKKEREFVSPTEVSEETEKKLEDIKSRIISLKRGKIINLATMSEKAA